MALLLALAVAQAVVLGAPLRANIVMIVADDLGYNGEYADMTCMCKPHATSTHRSMRRGDCARQSAGERTNSTKKRQATVPRHLFLAH